MRLRAARRLCATARRGAISRARAGALFGCF
jgi:hypothetical protein